MVIFFGTHRVSFSVLARILPDLGTGPDSTFFCIHTNLAQSIIDLLYHFFPFSVLVGTVFRCSHGFYLFLVLARILQFFGIHTEGNLFRDSPGQSFGTCTDSA